MKSVASLPVFDRKFWSGEFCCTQISGGALGGKANGLVFMQDLLSANSGIPALSNFLINVPTMAVIATDAFDQFLAENKLRQLDFETMSDGRIGNAFQRAELPIELLGDLRALIQQVKTPLAVRSSSLLEDALGRPFAGVYATKMLPNNQFDPDSRFRRLAEAIKLVYASVFFREAREYIRTTGREPCEEKMAVIIQEVVGIRRGSRFYPDISGVARSYNFYPMAPARPEDGIVTLALGLGKTIVDGDPAWSFSPAYPKKPPPFASTGEMLQKTQNHFWAVQMGGAPAYDPISEVEYLQHASLAEAEQDEVLDLLVSTYDSQRDRVLPGIGVKGPRVLDFSPLLVYEEFPVARAVQELLRTVEHGLNAPVEIEFAITFDRRRGEPTAVRFGFLQVRPLVVSEEDVRVSEADLSDPKAIVVSRMALGNASEENLHDIVYVRPEEFKVMQTPAIAEEIGSINRELLDQRRPFLLIGFGRWGSSHPSLGIPADWSQISGARVIVEATLPEMDIELSQGSHFFHNLSSFRASYLMVRYNQPQGINWGWLQRQPAMKETQLIRHVRLQKPLSVRVDGHTSRGIVLAPSSE